MLMQLFLGKHTLLYLKKEAHKVLNEGIKLEDFNKLYLNNLKEQLENM